MKKMFNDFLKNFKFYIDYILKLNFGELLFHFLELAIVVLLSLMMYIPVNLIQDLIYTIFNLLGNTGTILNLIFDIIFKIIGLIICIISFVYCFNKRYEDLQKEIKEKEEKKHKEKIKEMESLLDLPAVKDSKK